MNPSIREDTNLITSGIYNSIEIVTLVVLLEENFQIKVSPWDITEENFNTVDDITRFVNACRERGTDSGSGAEYGDSMQLSADSGDSHYRYPEDAKNVLDFLENAAECVPHKTAIVDPYGTRVTFSELLHQSQAVGTYIQKKYRCRKKPFIVLERRTVKSLIMFLGVIWSGNMYVALDESFEQERLEMMIHMVNPVGLLWHYNAKNEVVSGMDTELFDEMVETEPDLALMREIKEGYRYEDPLFGVYTSGTTGTPKCIIKSHGAMVDFIKNYVELFGFHHKDVLGSKLSLMFDAITKDMYTSLYCGATLHIMKRGNVLPPDDAVYLYKNGITSVVWSPSLLISFAQLHILENIRIPTLQRVLFVGEALPAKYMNYWLRYKPDALYVNLYGTSEMTGNCLYQIVDRPVELDIVPLNAVYPGYDVFLLDDDGRKVDDPGSVGEICVGGNLLCIDQLGKPMDPEKFTPNPLPDAKSDRIYHTGDIVRIGQDGTYIFVSRNDYRFKHAGYRIAPGEIEDVLNRLDFMKRAICLYDSIGMKIILFWQGDADRIEELYQYANENLPPHMLPGKYVNVPEFPLNNSGKVDRARLVRWIEATGGACDVPVTEIA